jgi:hypothetical protein
MELNQSERDFMISHTFADDPLTDPLQVTPPGRRLVFHFNLNDLDELVRSIAAEAQLSQEQRAAARTPCRSGLDEQHVAARCNWHLQRSVRPRFFELPNRLRALAAFRSRPLVVKSRWSPRCN